MGPTNPPIQWVPGSVRQGDHSPPSSAEVKKVDQIKEEDMGEACSSHGKYENCMQNLGRRTRREDTTQRT